MIDFALVTLDGTKFKHEVYEVIVPTPDGYMAILPGHIPIVSLVSGGAVSVRKNPKDRDEQLEVYAVSGGVINVEMNYVRVLVDTADHSDEINEQAASAAVTAARKLVAEAKDQVELNKAREMLGREATRLGVAQLRRHKHQ